MADAKPAAAPIDTSKGFTVLAQRAMYRAGRKWNAGANDVSAEDAAKLGEKDEHGKTGIAALAADRNFTLAVHGTKAVTIVGGGSAAAVNAHTLVMAQKPMYRAGRKWGAGANPLSAEEVEQLGEKGMAALKADRNFTVVQNATAAKAAETTPAKAA